MSSNKKTILQKSESSPKSYVVNSGNDYSILEKRVGIKTPEIEISIVIPVYNRIEMLRRTIAMITHQNYPLDLLEIIIADDGSEDNPEQLIDEFSSFFEINYVRQSDQGYRLSSIRNLGVRSARHDNIIILDCDMAPVPNLVRTYADWLILDEKVILIGHRRYVDANNISVEEVLNDSEAMLQLPSVETKNAVMKKSPSSDWREPIYEETNMLKTSPHPFRVSSCGNVAFHRRIFEDAGTFDEDFTAWGAEDNEFGYRVWNAGYLFIPLIDALGMHQEPPGGREFVDREAGKLVTRPMLFDRVPLFYREYDPDTVRTVPIFSLIIDTNMQFTGDIESCINKIKNQSFKEIHLHISTSGLNDIQLTELNSLEMVQNRNVFIHTDIHDAINSSTGAVIVVFPPTISINEHTIQELYSEIKNNLPGSCLRIKTTKEGISEFLDANIDSSMEMMVSKQLQQPLIFCKRTWSKWHSLQNVTTIRTPFTQKISVTVVIITRNRKKLLKDAIQSVLDQTHEDFELLIIDDGSEDNTSRMVKNFSDPRIRLIRLTPSGIPHARNLGVKEAAGDYIVIMDDDDVMLPNRIKDHLNALDEEASGSYGGWIDITHDDNLEFNPGKPHGFSQMLFSGKVLLHPAMMVKRSILEQFPYDESFKFGTDYVMNLEIAQAGFRFSHTGSYILLRRFHGKNVTTTNSGEQKETGRSKWQSFVYNLSPLRERQMRHEASISLPFEDTPKPTRKILQSWFPKIKIAKEDIPDIELKKKDIPTSVKMIKNIVRLGPFDNISELEKVEKTMKQDLREKLIGYHCSKSGIRPSVSLLFDSDDESNILLKKIRKEFSEQIVEIQEQIIEGRKLPDGAGVTRIIIGRSRNIYDIREIKKKIRKIRRTWATHIAAMSTGNNPEFSLMTGRLETKHAFEQVRILRKKMPGLSIVVDTNAPR